jgi:flagellar M-ring protein FliF
VVVSLAAGKSLSQSQISGIVHLVASAVPDLTDDRITLVDTKGNLIYRKQADTPDFAAGLTAGQTDHQRNYEKTLKSKVQSMLEDVLGQGRAVVRVAADLDFTKTTTTQDLFDPDQVAVRSEVKNTENAKGAGPGPTGSPDQRFALAQRNAGGGQEESQGSESTRETSTTNFEISRTQKQITQAGGNLKRLTVAVVVDGPYKDETPAGGQPTRSFTPRSAEEMRQITDLVRRAVGYNEQRGDEVTVANVPFALAAEPGMITAKGWQDYLKEYGKPLLNLLVALLFILMVVRPVLKILSTRFAPAAAGGVGGLPGGVRGEARRAMSGEELPPGESADMGLLEEAPRKATTRDQVLAVASQDPERATAILRAWIREA